MLHAPDMGADIKLKVSGSTYQSTLKHPCNFDESSLTYDRVQRRSTVNDLKGDNTPEPDPSQLVLCDCFHGRFAGYYDEIPLLYNSLGIIVVVFAIIATPLSLLCFIPAMEYMKKAERSVQEGEIIMARNYCNLFKKYLIGGIIWVNVFLVFAGTLIAIEVSTHFKL